MEHECSCWHKWNDKQWQTHLVLGILAHFLFQSFYKHSIHLSQKSSLSRSYTVHHWNRVHAYIINVSSLTLYHQSFELRAKPVVPKYKCREHVAVLCSRFTQVLKLPPAPNDNTWNRDHQGKLRKILEWFLDRFESLHQHTAFTQKSCIMAYFTAQFHVQHSLHIPRFDK